MGNSATGIAGRGRVALCLGLVMAGCSDHARLGADGGSSETLVDASDGSSDGGAAGGAFRGTSGERLRRRLLRSDTGVEQMVGWHDSARDEACWFTTAADGVLRCLPGGTHHELVFTDEACTQPAARVMSPTCEAPRYVTATDESGCGTRVQPIVQPIRATIVHVLDGGSCTPVEVGEDEVFELGPDIEPSEFASASVVRERAGSRLEVDVYVAEDGARSPWRLYDTELEAGCVTMFAADDQLRCLPWHNPTLSSEHFEDPACEVNLAVADPSVCFAQTNYLISRTVPDQACRAKLTVFELSPFTEEEVYEEAACTAVPTAEVDGELFAVGAEVPPEMLATATKELEATQNRLRGVIVRYADGPVLSRLTYYDAALETECRFQRHADGEQRCLPGWPHVAQRGDYYLDEACTRPVARFYGCAGESPTHVEEVFLSCDDLLAGSHEYRVYEIGERVRPEVLYWDRGGDCIDVSPNEASNYYQIGPEIPADRFVAGTRVVE